MENSRNWLTTTMRSIGYGLITTDLDGLVTYMNPVAGTLTGWPVATAHGMNMTWCLTFLMNRPGTKRKIRYKK